ncbi:MAG: hypothetical protein ACREP9_18785, partial [Candidatus Dormibacteraceae bacterium]
MPDGLYGEGDYGSEFDESRHDELSLGRPVPDDLRQIMELQRRLAPPSTLLSDQLPLLAPDASLRAKASLRFRVTGNLTASRGPKSLIELPPGTHLSSVLQFLLPAKWYRTRIQPLIADMQEEYFLALKAGREGHAWFIALRGHLFAVQTLLYGVADAIRRLLVPWKQRSAGTDPPLTTVTCQRGQFELVMGGDPDAKAHRSFPGWHLEHRPGQYQCLADEVPVCRQCRSGRLLQR